MFPFNLFKKKEIELPEEELPVQQDLGTEKQFYSGLDKEDLILSKLETINAKLDNMNERLKKIEEYAK